MFILFTDKLTFIAGLHGVKDLRGTGTDSDKGRIQEKPAAVNKQSSKNTHQIMWRNRQCSLFKA